MVITRRKEGNWIAGNLGYFIFIFTSKIGVDKLIFLAYFGCFTRFPISCRYRGALSEISHHVSRYVNSCRDISPFANSINGILTIVTLSKNSICIPCESREQPNWPSSPVCYSTLQYYPVIARNPVKIRTHARQIYCRSVSHNYVILSKLDTSTPPFWMAWYHHWPFAIYRTYLAGGGG